MPDVVLWRRLAAELLGTGLLVAIVVGSGAMASTLSPDDVGLQLLQNSIATALGLGVLIAVLGPVSGAHFNPVVTAAVWVTSRRSTPLGEVGGYVLAQVAGGIAGAVLANLMFDHPPVTWSTTERAGAGLWLGELVATAGLVLVVFGLLRSGRPAVIPAAVGAYIGAAYWFTSSTSFANPAVTIGRAFTDTFAGIAPSSVPGFVIVQLLGAAVGLAAVHTLHPRPVPRPTPTTSELTRNP